MMELAKRIICCFIAGCLIFVLAFFFTPLGAFIVIGLEDTFTKWEINNPHINNNLSEWEEVYISTDISFRIPPNWSATCENGIYSVTDATGTVWAIGTLFGTDADYFDDYSDFLMASICSEQFDLSIDICTEYVAMKGADIDKITIDHFEGSESYYIINLDTASAPSFLLVLFADISQSADAFDVTEAIMYSFAYK